MNFIFIKYFWHIEVTSSGKCILILNTLYVLHWALIGENVLPSKGVQIWFWIYRICTTKPVYLKLYIRLKWEDRLCCWHECTIICIVYIVMHRKERYLNLLFIRAAVSDVCKIYYNGFKFWPENEWPQSLRKGMCVGPYVYGGRPNEYYAHQNYFAI